MTCNCSNGIRSAAWLIGSVVLVVSVGLAAQLYYLITLGPTHRYACLYVFLAFMVLVYALASLYIVKHRSYVHGVTICAWAGLVCVLGMVGADARMFLESPASHSLDHSFPGIMFALSLGVFSLSSIVGSKVAIPYTVTAIVASCIVGVLYDKTDDAIMATVLPVAFFLLGHEFSKMHHQLCRLRRAVQIFNHAEEEVINGRPGRDSPANRADATPH